jgi:hypothetical protein
VKLRYALTGLGAAVLVFIGAGGATAAPMRPFTGSTGCTSSNYVHQYTTYHGVICYTNTGKDDLSTSGFWTSKVTAGSNTGHIEFYDTDGNFSVWYFTPGKTFDVSDYPDVYHGGVVSMTALYIQST